MITNKDKIEIINYKLNNLNFIIQSYIDHAELCKDKYSLEEKISECNLQKSILEGILSDLNNALTNQG